MSIYWTKNKDGTKTAYIDITIPGCERLRESTGVKSTDEDAKRLAQEYHDQRRVELWRQAKLGDKPRRTWNEAVLKWLEEKSHKKTIENDRGMLRWLWPHLKDVYLDVIDREAVEQILKKKEREASNTTVNRHAALIRSILRMAKDEWNWIDSVPKIRMRKENDSRVRYLSEEEAATLQAELAKNAPHLADAMEFTLNTGLRDANCSGLKWSQINFQTRAMYLYKTKNGRPLGTPLNSDALAILERRKGIHPVYVFTFRGKPLTRFNNSAWRKALVRAGIEDFHWHDLRHTWATWMVMSGCPLEQLKVLGGWRSMEMVMRYAHFSTEHLAQFSELVAKSKPILKVVK